MKIILSPVRRDDALVLVRTGDVLTVNGEEFDFSALPEGSVLPVEAIASDWFAGPVERVDGALHVPLILPHGANTPEDTRFPEAITLMQDGPVALPAYAVEEDAS